MPQTIPYWHHPPLLIRHFHQSISADQTTTLNNLYSTPNQDIILQVQTYLSTHLSLHQNIMMMSQNNYRINNKSLNNRQINQTGQRMHHSKKVKGILNQVYKKERNSCWEIWSLKQAPVKLKRRKTLYSRSRRRNSEAWKSTLLRKAMKRWTRKGTRWRMERRRYCLMNLILQNCGTITVKNRLNTRHTNSSLRNIAVEISLLFIVYRIKVARTLKPLML